MLQPLTAIHDNPLINMVTLIIMSVVSGCVLVSAFVICGDVYGAGPAFVAVTGGLGACAFCGHLWCVLVDASIVSSRACRLHAWRHAGMAAFCLRWLPDSLAPPPSRYLRRFARSKGTTAQHHNMNFGISLILGVAALQQAIMFGGLSTDTFESRMMALTVAIINASTYTCAAQCVYLDINDTVVEISQLGQQLDAEVSMVFFETLTFLVMIPVTLSFYVARDAKPSASRALCSLPFPRCCVCRAGSSGSRAS